LAGTATFNDSTVSGNMSGNGSAGSDGGDAGSNLASATGSGGSGDRGGNGGKGGGISNGGFLTVTNVTISGNSVGDGGAGGDSGAGLGGTQSGGDGGDAGSGGGIHNPTYADAVTMVFTTIARNQAGGEGGLGGSGTPAGEDGSGGQGGGVFNGQVFAFAQTILADNKAADAGYDCYGTLTTGDYNLIEDISDCTLIGSTKIITGVDPKLAPLGDNGGPTDTHLPLPRSPALDGNGTSCNDANGDPLLVDQRGRVRPVDGDGSGTAQCDTGAVEVQDYVTLTVTVTGDGQGNVCSTPVGIDCGDGSIDCQEIYDRGTVVTLSATAAKWSMFTSWGGDCGGTAAACNVTMAGAKSVTATFDLMELVFVPVVVRDAP
jgi:hypothetical protein